MVVIPKTDVCTILLYKLKLIATETDSTLTILDI